MSKTPYERINHWKAQEGHTHGKVLHENKTYDQALALEKSEAAKKGCYCHPGGDRDQSSKWAVYHVWGGKTPAD